MTLGKRNLGRWWASAAVALVPIVGSTGCKPSAELSRTKSLDNFTSKDRTKLTYNSCSGRNPVKALDSSLRGDSQQVDAIKTALTAVPVELQTAFFQDLKGSINVVKDITGVCAAKSSAQGSADDLLACWRGGEAGISILIREEESTALTDRNIKHSTVRMMGYVLTDVILKVKQSSGEALEVENPALLQVKKDVATALTKDTEKSKDYRIPSSLKSDEIRYNDAAFAEAFDSYYCSATSQSKMASSFPETFAIFSEIAAVLPQGLAGTLDMAGAQTEVAASGNTISGQDGFSLWRRSGRWFNGPIRQGFSNWLSYRRSGEGYLNFRRARNQGGFIFDRR
jgi:hypothetical protein